LEAAILTPLRWKELR